MESTEVKSISTSKLFSILLIVLFFPQCKETAEIKETSDKDITIDRLEVAKEDLVLNQVEGKWYYHGQPFNGYSLRHHKSGILAEKIGYYEGKREGIAKKWSENGVLRVVSNYLNNRLSGSYKSWWENGVLAQEAEYLGGVLNGVEKKWYPTGELAKLRQLVGGKEEGLQKAWLQNGKLYVNYEAKNGRIFGMRRANSCYKLENEVVSRDKKI